MSLCTHIPSMFSYPYVLIFLCSYILMFLCSYVFISLCSYILMLLYSYVLMSLYPYALIFLCSYVFIPLCPYVLMSLYPYVLMFLCLKTITLSGFLCRLCRLRIHSGHRRGGPSIRCGCASAAVAVVRPVPRRKASR